MRRRGRKGGGGKGEEELREEWRERGERKGSMLDPCLFQVTLSSTCFSSAFPPFPHLLGSPL